MPKDALTAAARRLERRIDTLAHVTDEPGRLTRTFLSPGMRQANRLVGSWMREAGLAIREDRAGNLIGRLEGPGRKTFLVGSHLDTVRDAGRFDGALGVLIAIAAIEELRERRISLPFPLEVLGFSEEEGVRFASAYLGSKGYIGALTKDDLALTDSKGISIGKALESLGHKPGRIEAAHPATSLLGYFEVHIEQGPVLEARDVPLGVVTGIAGQTRARISLKGKAGHAGTTPMRLRKDALAGAAEFTLAAEALARKTPSLVATVGTMSVSPGAANVVPGLAEFSLDLRHPKDAVRKKALRSLQAKAKAIARARGLGLTWRITQDNGAVHCSGSLAGLVAKAVKAETGTVVSLPSGAGHDGVVISEACPIAMLFVRCREGLSHHPDEFVSFGDLRCALAATIRFLQELAEEHRP